jgi:osmoprotectant transport system ATP-binding protein
VIKLEHISKTYPGANDPAVEDVTFEVPEGETCVLIGPSGCGKTTTLKMINRLIEPTEGKIFLQGEDILQRDPVVLRREIGYVIQQIGLFPHMTIRDNIATVPVLLGWKPAKIDQRVDELLAMVGMEPSLYRERYPRELSGGQRQRVGVVRALAADPPLMLMDEPFGAIDPINRDHLQNEFLRLQKKINKTIVFVTHDIDEAIKMGTLICILQVGGKIEQFDSPSNILATPANEFVADFVGADRGLKRLNLVRVMDVMRPDIETLSHALTAEDAIVRMRQLDLDSMLVVDDEEKLLGFVTLEGCEGHAGKRVEEFTRAPIAETEEEATMKNVFSEMLSYGVGYMPVLGDAGVLKGIVTASDVQELIHDASPRSTPAS